jgi:lysophospholipase L1-like esterase
MKLKTIVVFATVVCLIVSFCINMILYQQVMNQYRMLQRVRLDPAFSRVYSGANARIGEPQPGVARVIFFGDSRMAYWNPLPVLDHGQLLNRGMPSETTAQALLRLKQDVLELKPNITVVQIGINDLKNIGLFPERKDEIVTSCWENLHTIVEQMGEHNIHVVLLTVFSPGPVDFYHKSLWSEDIREGVDRVNEKMIGLIGPGITVVDCDALLSPDQSVKPEYAEDTYHLTSTGYVALNDALRPILEELIQDRLN